MTEGNQIDMGWHAERLLRDGYLEEAARVRAEAGPVTVGR
jgi:hypothetical protein